MPDPQPLEVTTTPVRGGCVVKLTGRIDEQFDGRKLANNKAKTLVIDLDGVTQITSAGVREWVLALQALEHSYVAFTNARPILVSQFNMVLNFGGKGELLSFYAPYICSACGACFDVLVDRCTQHEEIRELLPPDRTCPSCSAEAELDDLPESYFSYAARAPRPVPPPEIESVLRNGGGRPVFRIDKVVDRELTALWLFGALDEKAHFKRITDGLDGEVVLFADGLVDVEPEALERFTAAFERAQITPWVVRAGPLLLKLLQASESARKRIKLGTARISLRCAKCEASHFVDLDALKLPGWLRSSGPCPACAQPLQPPETLLATLFPLSFDLAGAELLEYASAGGAAKPAHEITASGGTGVQRFGRYELVRSLGVGGMAEVFLALQSAVGGFQKQVVVKRILPHHSADPSFVAMFLEEARVAAHISHRNVVQIFDVGEVDSRHFIAMEYVRGWDLNLLLRLAREQRAQFPLEVAARIVADIAAGLHAAHTCVDPQGRQLQVIHRDVSPHNVLVSTGGEVKLTDFGIAKASDSRERTPAATLKGKLAYLAPEQVRSEGRAADVRTDIFPAGIILYTLITGRQPFKRDTEFATLRAIISEPVPDITHSRPEAAPLQPILARAMAADPNARYASALELHRALSDFLQRSRNPSGSQAVATFINGLTESLSQRTAVELSPLTSTRRETDRQTRAGELE